MRRWVLVTPLIGIARVALAFSGTNVDPRLGAVSK